MYVQPESMTTELYHRVYSAIHFSKRGFIALLFNKIPSYVSNNENFIMGLLKVDAKIFVNILREM